MPRLAASRPYPRRLAVVLALAAGLVAGAGGLRAQEIAPSPAPSTLPGGHGPFPFYIGERLEYSVRVPKVAMSGRGTMSVEEADPVRGHDVLLLRFDFQARLGFIKAQDRTISWVDPRRMAALRFVKHEHHPLSSHDDSVEVYPDERRWRDAEGGAGGSPTDASLDELSFIYFVRTLPLAADTVYRFDRHFDPARNPIAVRLLGRETVKTGAGTFRTLVVEMRVRDPRHFKGEGVLRINLTDDHCRLPVRLESVMPKVGSTIFTLESHTHPMTHVMARVE